MDVLCDIIVPVYNSLTYARDCLDSVLRFSSAKSYQLYIIDDGSDAYTKDFLEDYTWQHDHISLHRNDSNIGFVKSCNLGLQLGRAPFVIFLNSDVVVTPGWLERLIKCAESDDSIAFVNPLTNRAAEIDVPMAPGANFFGMNELVQGTENPAYPDVVTGVGFCMLLRRHVLDELGTFDEVYGRGYCEESDLCMRLTSSGYRTVVADDVYVYHKGRGTFVDRDAQYTANRRIFDGRWKSKYERQYRAFLKADPLAAVRHRFQLPKRWDPMPAIWTTARKALDHWRAQRRAAALQVLISGGGRVLHERRDCPSNISVSRVTRPNRLRVTYVLHDLLVAGGVLSVVQLVNELILLGVEARIVALYEDPVIEDWVKMYTRPIIFRNVKELVELFPESDIAVATLWRTVPWLCEAVHSNRVRKAAYFIQDFEPWFYGEEQREKRRQVMDMYRRIDHRIVKSNWLQSMLNQEGFDSHKIPLGMDLGRFYPRHSSVNRPTVIAMARPQTPRRGFLTMIDALARVKQAVPEVDIILFGDRFLRRQAIPFPFRDEGVVTNQEHLARLYAEAHVFLDGSDFQGFGRCGLEAMACGTACVLTDVGGVNEYAIHKKNALLIPPGEPETMSKSMIALLQNEALRHTLIDHGRKTASAYDHKREAQKTLAYFKGINEG